jgi:LacI family transcriptional regulator
MIMQAKLANFFCIECIGMHGNIILTLFRLLRRCGLTKCVLCHGWNSFGCNLICIALDLHVQCEDMAASQNIIAESLNLSVATVSRSLRNHPAISAETRARVAEAAVRLGYRLPEGGDRATRGRPRRASAAAEQSKPKMGLIHLAAICRGSITPDSVHNLVAFRLVQGMSIGARALRASLHIEYLPPEEFDKLHHPDCWPLVVQEKVASGVVLVNQPSSAAIKTLAKTVPCINFERHADCTDTDCVTEDNLGSISQLFDHFLSLGHRRIGLVDSRYDLPSYQARLGAYVQNLVERSMPFDPADAILPDAPMDLEARYQALAAHIEDRLRRHHVTAWICLNDFVGYRIIGQLNKRGLRVPEDVSIAAFDNFDPPPGLPKLTTIDGPFETMGQVAVERLVKRVIQSDIPPLYTMLRTRLIIGKSTGPAP